MNWKRFVAGSLVAALGALVVAGCGGKSTGDTTAPNGGNTSGKPAIKLGVLVSETGSSAWLGDPEVKGARLAVEAINAGGGINGQMLELVTHNDESTPEKAVVGAKKLIEQEKVAAIIGTSVVATSKAVAALTKEKGPVVFSLSGGYEPEHKYMFAGSVQTQHMQETVFDWLKSNGLKKVALLATTDSTGQTAVDAINKVAPAKGIEVVAIERMNATDVDVTPQLSRIRSQGPDLVISWLTGKPAAVVGKNFNQLGFKVPLVLSHGNLSFTFIDSIKAFQPELLLLPATKDLAWADLGADDSQRKLLEPFNRKYTEKYKGQADFGPPVAYDAVMLVAEAIKKAGSTDPDKVVEALEQINNHTGLVATYNFSKDDHRGTGRKDTVLVQIKDGKFNLFWK